MWKEQRKTRNDAREGAAEAEAKVALGPNESGPHNCRRTEPERAPFERAQNESGRRDKTAQHERAPHKMDAQDERTRNESGPE